MIKRRLENIKDKKEEQLQVVKDQGEKQLKKLTNIDKNKTLKTIKGIRQKNAEANKLLPEFRKIDETFDNVELVRMKIDRTKYDFNRFSFPIKFIEKIHNYEITLDEAIEKQAELAILINKRNNVYNQRSTKQAKEIKTVFESAKKLFDARKDIIEFFEKRIFPHKNNVFKTKEEESEEESKDSKYIQKESKSINYDLFEKHFGFVAPTVLATRLYETKDKNKNNEFVNVIKSRLCDLKDEMKKLSEDGKELNNQIKY